MTSQISVIAGDLSNFPFGNRGIVFAEKRIEFISDLSKLLRKLDVIKEYPDIANFAFWCRKSNIANYAKSGIGEEDRVGLGTVFHITPANVPINFAFSWALSFLAGNSNLVRLSSTNFTEVDLVLSAIKEIFESDHYKDFAESNCFIRYEHDDSLTKEFMELVDGRVIWGSNLTIENMKRFHTKVRCRDVLFSSRTSAAIISGDALAGLDDKEFARIASLFLRDSLTYSQLGCSSPRSVHWLFSENECSNVRSRFWSAVEMQVTENQILDPAQAMTRLVNLCKLANKYQGNLSRNSSKNPMVERIMLNDLDESDIEASFRFGTFRETVSYDLQSAVIQLLPSTQTICYYGIDSALIFDEIAVKKDSQVDRVVPFGAAFDISMTWDGIDVIRALSRIIELR